MESLYTPAPVEGKGYKSMINRPDRPGVPGIITDSRTRLKKDEFVSVAKPFFRRNPPVREGTFTIVTPHDNNPFVPVIPTEG